jgi:hypothetical protein
MLCILVTKECVGHSSGPCPPSSPNPVNIIFHSSREVIIDNHSETNSKLIITIVIYLVNSDKKIRKCEKTCMVSMKCGQLITYSSKFIIQTLVGIENPNDRMMESRYTKLLHEQKTGSHCTKGHTMGCRRHMCFQIKT